MLKRLYIMLIAVSIFFHISIFNAHAAGINGSIDYQIEKAAEGVFVVDEKPAVNIKITIPQSTNNKFEIKLITDYTTCETVLVDDNGGQQQELRLEFNAQNEGYHHFCAQLLRNGALYHEYEFEQYYIKSVKNDAYNDRGYNVHYSIDSDFFYDAKMLKASGVPVLRVGLSWNGVEQEKGVYDFTNGDAMVKMLEDNGFEAVCIIDSYRFSHELYPDSNGNTMIKTKEQISAFADFAEATVKRYPQIKKWEIFNEPNFLMTGQEYFNVVYEVAKRIKNARPDAEVYAGGLAIYNTGEFVNGFYVDKLYPYVDGISYHHYNHWRYADGPEFNVTTDELVNKMKTEGGWKRLILTESGYSTGVYNMQVPEIKQASENVKRAVICDWYGIDFLTMYDFRNDGYDAEEIEHNFGTVTHDYEPKPAYFTFKQYQKNVNRAMYIGEAYLSEDITAHLYASNDDYFMIAWAKNADDEADIRYDNPVSAEYTFTDENVRIEDMFGKHIGGNILRLTYKPMYIHGLSKDFCLNAIGKNKDYDLFENMRAIAAQIDKSTDEAEQAYKDMYSNATAASAESFADSCYDLADRITDEFLDGVLDIPESRFSNILSEIYKTCERGLRVAVLFDDECSAPKDIAEQYAAKNVLPEDIDKTPAYINEPYYMGRSLLNKIMEYDEKDRVKPVTGSGFVLKSDNTLIFAGSSVNEEVLIKIDGAGGEAEYINLIPTDGNGNYYFELEPDIEYGNYTVTVNNGTAITETLDYHADTDYISVEDKMTALSRLHAQKLLQLYEQNLEWADVKYNYLHPKVKAVYSDETEWITITGKVERTGLMEYSDIILMAYEKGTDELKYIDTTYPDDNGKYRFSFKYEEDVNNLYIKINQGGVLLNTEIKSVTEENPISGNITITKNQNRADIELRMQNNLGEDVTVQPIVAYYDESGRMINCRMFEPENVGAGEITISYTVEIPESAAVMKAFAWDSISEMRPYMKNAEMIVKNNK